MDKVAGLKKKAAKLKNAPKPKDNRPLTDASYQKEQLVNVFKYLVTHNYSQPISVTQLLSPGKQEVWSALSFILEHRINSDKFVRSFAELPVVARELGYPYALVQGPTTANHQATLGFLFWLCDLIRVMDQKKEECGDPMTLYFFNSYSVYLEEPDVDKRVAERHRLFVEIQNLHSQDQYEKVELNKEAEQLEACCKASPSLQLEQLEADIEFSETENQNYLMEVLAPLDETKHQLIAAKLQPPQHLITQLDATQAAIEALDLQSETLTAEYSSQVRNLQETGLTEVSEAFVAEIHRQSQEQLQELEHEDWSLAAQVELYKERKIEIIAAKETARKLRIHTLQQRLAEVQEQRAAVETLLAREEEEQGFAIRTAQQALREDLAFVQQHIPVLSA